MENDAIDFIQEPHAPLQISTRELLDTVVVDGAVNASAEQAPTTASAADNAVGRVRDMVARVRAQCFARLAFPWRFEDYPLAELADQPGDAELDHVCWEIDHRYRAAVLGDDDA